MTSSHHGAIVISAIVAISALVACNGVVQPPAPTAIESFTITPNPVASRGTITLSWRAVNTGLYEGSPYCTLQRTIQSSPADDAQQVDCSDTITAVAPSEATTMTYRLSALKRDGATYVTRDVTVNVQAPSTMLIEVDTNLIAGTTVNLPLRGSVDVTVDWGDGQTNTATNSGDLQHTYASNGRYTIGISGSLEQFGSGWDDYPGAEAITGLAAWGELGLASLSGAFRNASNLISVPATLPPTVTILDRLFYGAAEFNHPIGAWDTSNVTTMFGLFVGAQLFNQPIDGWETGKVTSMQGMFAGARRFNQPIGAWDTGSVTDVGVMFLAAEAFNQPIGTWNTGNVTQMYGMFAGASAFDQPIGAWDTRNVIDMGMMFDDATAFNQPIGDWDTSNVFFMDSMFGGATSFNRDLSDWCVPLIPGRPDGFDDGATSWTLPQPVWGTCP